MCAWPSPASLAETRDDLSRSTLTFPSLLGVSDPSTQGPRSQAWPHAQEIKRLTIGHTAPQAQGVSGETQE